MYDAAVKIPSAAASMPDTNTIASFLFSMIQPPPYFNPVNRIPRIISSLQYANKSSTGSIASTPHAKTAPGLFAETCDKKIDSGYRYGLFKNTIGCSTMFQLSINDNTTYAVTPLLLYGSSA